MFLHELLAQARAFIKDKTAVKEPVIAAVQPTQIPQSSPPITCYESNGPNHFVRPRRGKRQLMCIAISTRPVTWSEIVQENKVGYKTSAQVYFPDSK